LLILKGTFGLSTSKELFIISSFCDFAFPIFQFFKNCVFGFLISFFATATTDMSVGWVITQM